MNEYIGKSLGLDVDHCQGGDYIWNILTVDGVRYEYDATDVGADAMAFFKITHGYEAEYDVEKFGGSVAQITGLGIEKAVVNYTRAQGYNCKYIIDDRSSKYMLRNVSAPGYYYYAVKQYGVSDAIQSKPNIQFGGSDIVLPALTDDELIQYLDE